MIRYRIQQGKAFGTLIGIYPYGTDQGSSDVFNQPAAIRQTMTVSVTHTPNHNVGMTFSRMGLNGAVAGQTGTITVVSNDFSDPAEILLGDYRILSNVDWVPGVGINATATSVAAAINRFPGFIASANGAVVSVLYEGASSADVDFLPLYHGEITNFTFAPNLRLMTKGSPQADAPLVT